MKKTIALLLSLTALLTGCTPRAETASDTAAGESGQQTTQPAASCWEQRQPVGTEGNLWYLPQPEVEQGYYSTLYTLGDDLLLCSMGEENGQSQAVLRRLSVPDGRVLAEASFDSSGYVTLQTGDESVALCDAGAGTVHLLDGQLQTLAAYTPGTEEADWYVSADGQRLYSFGWSEGVDAVELQTGQRSALVEDAGEVCILGRWAQGVAFSYLDAQSQMYENRWLDLQTGTLEPLPVEGDFTSVSRAEDLWVFSDYNDWQSHTVSTAAGQSTVQWEGNRLEAIAPGCLLTVDAPCRELSLYEPDGTFRSRCCLSGDEGAYVGTNVIFHQGANGCFFLEILPDGGEKLLFWDTGAAMDGEALGLVQPAQETGGDAADPALYDRAAALSEEYGVDIRIADRCLLDYSHYDTYAITDAGQISRGLDELEKALSVYPEGFFRQLCYGRIRTIRIELVGGLTAKQDADTVESAAAFAQEQPGEYLLAADVNVTDAPDYYHEFTHILDKRLDWDAQHRPDALFSEDAWAALEPEGFAYAMSYTQMPDSVWQYVDSGYFVSDYSCTYPTEDRATMMEAAITGSADLFPPDSGLRRKLEYYCRCIRDCLDTEGWPETMAWETVLSQ